MTTAAELFGTEPIDLDSLVALMMSTKARALVGARYKALVAQQQGQPAAGQALWWGFLLESLAEAWDRPRDVAVIVEHLSRLAVSSTRLLADALGIPTQEALDRTLAATSLSEFEG